MQSSNNWISQVCTELTLNGSVTSRLCRPLPTTPASGEEPSSIATQRSAARQFCIDPATISLCYHQDGTPFKLGQGGFGSVSPASLAMLLLTAHTALLSWQFCKLAHETEKCIFFVDKGFQWDVSWINIQLNMQ